VFDADFFLGFDSILYHDIKIGKCSVIFQLKQGRFTADLTELALYGGTGKGRVVLDGSGPVPAIDQSFELKDVNILPLLQDADNVTLLSGIGNLDMAIQGHGRSQRDIIGSLSGSGALRLEHGALKGVDIVNMVKSKSAAMALDWIGIDQESVFAGFGASYTITDGVLKNTDLRMDLPNLPTTGAGTVDLPHRRVAYRLIAKVNGSIVVPVDVAGPWDHLTYKPDIRTTLENFLPDWLIDLFVK
jgi:AsmA protein